jgi:hypothetical protein
MTASTPCIHLSASAIQAFKACPVRYRLGFYEGIRKAESTEAQRIGTNWGALHEVYWNNYNANLGDAHDRAFYASVQHLNDAYEDVPPSVDPFDWEVEYQTLLNSFVAYFWWWEDDPIEVLGSEVGFELPLHAPRTGLPLPLKDVKRVGMMDHVVRWRGAVGPLERKSTSKAIHQDSEFWERIQKDTQVDMYALAFRDIADQGFGGYGIHGVRKNDRVGNTLYDVWRKPGIRPIKVNQKDTEAFVESGEYYGVQFNVEWVRQNDGRADLMVDGQPADIEFGKSGKASIVRETPAMFGARLLDDISERPEYYFQRREIGRTEQQLQRARTEQFNIYTAMRMFAETGCWYENESSCRSPFPCEFIPICFGPGADAVCNSESVPDGFRRIKTA